MGLSRIRHYCRTMMTKSLATAILGPALLLLALTGCAPGGGGTPDDGDAATSGPAPDDEAAAGAAGCAPGHVWSADVDDMAAQLHEQYLESGIPARETTAVGSQVLDWGADGAIQLDTDYTFTVVADLGEGLVMTMNQHHFGPTTGVLTIEGDVAVPSDFDSSVYQVSTAVDINGTASEAPIEFPDAAWEDAVELQIVSCSDTTLKTFPTGGIVTQTWTRQD
jgi:hypothetical protein